MLNVRRRPFRPRPDRALRALSASGSTGVSRVPRRRLGWSAAGTVLALLVALLVPSALSPAPARAATVLGSFDSAATTLAGTVAVAGWAADPATPTTAVRIEFRDAGVYRGAVMASQARPDVAAVHPELGANHGFSFALSLADGVHPICAWVTFASAAAQQLGCHSVTVANNPVGTANPATVNANTATITGTATDANTTGPVLVRVYRDGGYAGGAWTTPADHTYQLSLPVAEGSHQVCVYAINSGAGANSQLGCQTVVVRNNPFGALETVGQLPSGVQVTGWAIDLNTTGAVLVRAYVDGQHVTDGWANLPRPDIAKLYPSSGPNHGYSFLFQLAEGTHTVCTRAVNYGPGVWTVIACKQVLVRNNPLGALESAGQVPGGIMVAGYALDLNSAGPIGVHVYLDGHFAGGAYATQPRADVANLYPTAGPDHGYRFTIPAGSGTHQVCAYALNVGAGGNIRFPCRTVAMQDNPVGRLENAAQSPGGVTVGGWTLDPDVTTPVQVRAYVDGKWVAGGLAGNARPDLARSYPYAGQNHGFTFAVPMTPGTHLLCLYAMNLAGGTVNTRFGCATVTRQTAVTGSASTLARSGTSNTIQFAGWALDPDTTGAVPVHVTVDGVDRLTVSANSSSSGVPAGYPLYGGSHGYAGSITLDPNEHQVCVIAYNVGAGTANRTLGCALITTSGDAAPAVPTQLTAWPGSKQVTLSWTAPRSVNAPIAGYQLTINPGNHTVPVSGSATSVVSTKLTNGVQYTFTLRGVNSLGVGSGASVTSVPTNIPPQTTPAPVSTSHYIRNITGNLSGDAALMRTMGANDAAHNPSGHNYLILLQIGGQDEADHGALLSATARYISYPAVVSAMNAYLDGYVTRQQPYAPLTLAIGTNNDVDVSSSAGVSWARNVVNPVASYAASHHPGIIIAGANDMEPGFSASVGATRSWLSGYLSATSARFVFNGSADGCSTGAPGGWCNNGWQMSDLQWLAGGAAPTRTISLPQIYNYAMPQQWKNISLTGINAGRSRINFGGPLTEYTACQQAGSCGSITNIDAWNQLWSAINSTSATRQSQLPNGTDLRIN